MRSKSLEIKCCSGKITIILYTLNVFHMLLNNMEIWKSKHNYNVLCTTLVHVQHISLFMIN